MKYRTCSNCHEKVPYEQERCSCGKWFLIDEKAKTGGILLCDVKELDVPRIQTGFWDFLFGTHWKTKEKGMAATSVTLLAGAPGAGKSTLLMTVASQAAKVIRRESIYLSTEEPEEQLKERADRLEIDNQNQIRLIPLNTGFESMPDPSHTGLIILDSVNGLAGSDMNEAVRVCKMLKEHVRISKYPAIAISHINKRGEIAGLEALQHEVDCTMTFFPTEESLGEESPREIVVEKNRNGQAYLKLVMRMTEKGLVYDPDINSDKTNEAMDS